MRPREHAGGCRFLFLNLILNERLKQKSAEQAAETELMNGFFVNGSIFENASVCVLCSRPAPHLSARLKSISRAEVRQELRESQTLVNRNLKGIRAEF